MQPKPVNFINLFSKSLLEGSEKTNFIYEIKGIAFDEINIEKLNSLDPKGIREYFVDMGASFQFTGIEGKVFKNNLILIESILPVLLSEIILFGFIYNINILSEIIGHLEISNPLNIPNLHGVKFYTYKIKELLRHLALGMEPYTIWQGEGNIYNYYPILKVDNSIIYYTDNTNKFIELLLAKTFIQLFPSGCKLSQLYFEDDKFFIKVNFALNLKTANEHPTQLPLS